MDTRTDPGQYYPGGRVMVRPDVAPPQGRVRWGDIVGKPDFSDVATLEAEDSLGNVKTNVNKIVDKMKTALIVLMCGLSTALSALAATTLNGLPGTAEVYTAAETDAAIIRLAPASITNDIATVVNTKQDKLPYPTNGIPYSVISDIPPPVTNRYPLFVIDLNPSEARVWQHIELKATTNNFENDSLVFYGATTDNEDATSLVAHDWFRLFLLSKRADTDIRRWTRISRTGDLDGYAPLAIAVLVDTGDANSFRRGQERRFAVHDRDPNLVWSYVRIDSSAPETDQDGRSCWRPVMPVKWYAELPDWATNDCSTVDASGVKSYVDPWLEAIDDADTSYQRFKTVTNVNQSVQYVTSTPDGTLNIEIPTGQASTRDWVVYCNFGAETSITLPAATWWMADAAYTNAIPANQPTALYFTQVTDGVYMLSRQELTSMLIQH